MFSSNFYACMKGRLQFSPPCGRDGPEKTSKNCKRQLLKMDWFSPRHSSFVLNQGPAAPLIRFLDSRLTSYLIVVRE